MIEAVEPRYTRHIPERLLPGVLYISEHYETAMHLCACGCEAHTVTPFGSQGPWGLTSEDGTVTLDGSILNRPCNAHYWIRRNEVVRA